ncbi:hypothetical protein HF638_12595 [Paenibacillus sp. SZ31]|uniref:hypothetical protein n=1 Tax=unclassified Paenibacillus TaxID=185978 RepID=UPI00146F33A2|nr:hypothetical protein [Paenibacillus sp. SZ31]NMI04822.1 hypothetical protein [Paenibacillus sp. SZ31]
MGRHKINDEDKLQGFMVNIKGYILDNISDDPNALEEIRAFIESRWGIKDIEKYDERRKDKHIELLVRNIELEKVRLVELDSKYGIKSEIYKIMGPAAIKKIAKYENELTMVKDSNVCK